MTGRTLTWFRPPDPGADVTKVRDKHGRTWIRESFTDRSTRWRMEGDIRLWPWPNLLFDHGPLENATEDDVHAKGCQGGADLPAEGGTP